MTHAILCIDDDRNFTIHLQLQLEARYRVYPAADMKSGMEVLSKNIVDIVLLDIGLEDIDGVDGLKMIRQRYPGVPVVMLTANRDPKMVVETIQAGASDYVCKPFEIEELIAVLDRVDESIRLREHNLALLATMNDNAAPREMIGQSPALTRLLAQVEMLRGHSANVLIEGASGTGKELLARYIHKREGDPVRPFVAINCAAIPDDLLESELFGHEKGAFTGAIGRKIGKFELAGGGDIFLDEISSLKIDLQAKILRALQERSFYRTGGNGLIQSNFRVISSTNYDLEEMIAKKMFRADLFHRLRVVHLKVPSLSERKDDISLLSSAFLKKYARGSKPKTLNNDAMNVLQEYDWPGNVRELENLLHSLIIMSQGDVITSNDMPDWIIKKLTGRNFSEKCEPHQIDTDAISLKEYLKMAERQFISAALHKHNGDRLQTANALKIPRSTFYLKLRELGID